MFDIAANNDCTVGQVSRPIRDASNYKHTHTRSVTMQSPTVFATPTTSLRTIPMLEHDVQHFAARRHVSVEREKEKSGVTDRRKQARPRFVRVREGQAMRHSTVANEKRTLRLAAQISLCLFSRHSNNAQTERESANDEQRKSRYATFSPWMIPL